MILSIFLDPLSRQVEVNVSYQLRSIEFLGIIACMSRMNQIQRNEKDM